MTHTAYDKEKLGVHRWGS